ncbi:flagellar hook-associated protein FlgK [Prosthecomicrobium sp. N25]|uniref:flagellar hook-associated protein FlgK n=1 Tax=Prosthecomicrobium sp. N25 TaxID=3129254 RepID=UPI00307833BE
MAISTAISIAVAGLGLTQRETDVVAQNIARADQPGYTRKELTIADYVGQSGTIGLRGTVQRHMDYELQRQVIQATPTTAFAETQNRYATRLDQLMGIPGTANSVASDFSRFAEALQALATTPDSVPTRAGALNAAQSLATRLNQLSADVQAMRTEAESAIADAVTRVNELTENIARLNEKLVSQKAAGQDITTVADARDLCVKELATLVDVQTLEAGNGQMTVFTMSGATLVGAEATELRFDKQGMLTPTKLWDRDPAVRGVGTITLGNNPATAVDVIDSKLFRSGKIAALVDARDSMLVKAQNQLDAMAAALADAMSGDTVQGTAVTSGAQAGFDIDLSGLKAGNAVTFEYLDNGTGKTKTVSLIRVDDPSILPLDNAVTGNPDDVVYGIDFSGGMGSVATQIQAALGSAFTVSNPSGSTIRILDDGAANTVDPVSLSARVTMTAVVDGKVGLPLFTDGKGAAAVPYTGALEGATQKRGFASRIGVNPAVLTDPTLLVKWQTSPATLAGDPSRPNEMIARLNDTTFDFGPETGVASGSTAVTSTVRGFADAVISYWGMISEDTKSAFDMQTVLQNNVEARANEIGAVNVDQELARLIQLQSAYAANARVMQTAREMLDTLMRT